MQVGAAVNLVRARTGAQIDVRAAGRALLRVVHGSIHAHFLNGLRSRRGNGLANCKVNGGATLNRNGAEGGGATDPRVIHNAG